MSETNNERVRAAMERLFAGRALHERSNRLTVTALAKEAGLTRQQVHRTGLVPEFHDHRERLLDAPAPDGDDALARIRLQLDEVVERAQRYRQERDALRHELTVAANAIRVLDEQNRRLEDELATAGVIVSLPTRTKRSLATDVRDPSK